MESKVIEVQKDYMKNIKEINTNKLLKYYILTMGCQLNENDSEKLVGMVEQMGYIESKDLNDADLYLINTCCVRENAEEKVFGKLGELKKIKENKDIIIAISGCMMQEEHINIYYVCIDASNCDYTISTATQFAIGEILDGDDFFAWYPMDYQNPERIKFAGDFTYLYYKNQEAGTFPSADLTTTDYNVMKQYYTVMTEEQSEKFQIVDGELALREDKLTEQEKLWADDKNIPYM